MIYLSNAFSLQMQGENECTTHQCSLEDAKNILVNLVPGPYINRKEEKNGTDAIYKMTAQSCVGHADVAAVLSELIEFDVPVNRISIKLNPGDILVVGQYVGPRLPEGATKLPDGARIDWYIVNCKNPQYVENLENMYNDLGRASANLAWPEGEKMLYETASKYFPQYFDEHAFD
jgi:hypothetical protein